MSVCHQSDSHENKSQTNRKLRFQRHRTGATVQESKRRKTRDSDMKEYDEDSIKEFDLKAILSHRRAKNNRLLYKVSWMHTDLETEITRQHFVSTQILREYWSRYPNNERPQEFRSRTRQRSRAN
jgi:hypothetical protein